MQANVRTERSIAALCKGLLLRAGLQAGPAHDGGRGRQRHQLEPVFSDGVVTGITVVSGGKDFTKAPIILIDKTVKEQEEETPPGENDPRSS